MANIGIIYANMKTPSSPHGFTLVELLVTIAIVGIIAVGATSQLSGMNNAASEARNQQNAQLLASVAMAAQAAGLDFIDPDGDLSRTVAAISRGDRVRRGAFAGECFRVPLGALEADAATAFLRIDQEKGMLVYVAE